MSTILEKVKTYEDNYNRLVEKMASPEVSADHEKIKESGVDLIIGKPFQVVEILEAVNHYVCLS